MTLTHRELIVREDISSRTKPKIARQAAQTESAEATNVGDACDLRMDKVNTHLGLNSILSTVVPEKGRKPRRFLEKFFIGCNRFSLHTTDFSDPTESRAHRR
jgi:hypothetical protein